MDTRIEIPPSAPAALALDPAGGVQRQPPAPPGKLRTHEKARLAQWAEDADKAGTEITVKLMGKWAKRLKQDRGRVIRFLRRTVDTSALARRIVAARMAQVADTTMRTANAVDGLEILHRSTVLSKPAVDIGAGGTVNVIVGMPGRPAMVPPTRSDMLEAQAKVANRSKVVDVQPVSKVIAPSSPKA